MSRFSQNNFRMDFSKGYFRGQKYSLSFDFFGHIHDQQSFIYEDFIALQIGYTALVLVDSEGAVNPTDINGPVKEWKFSDSNVLVDYMAILAQNNIDLKQRILSKIMIVVENSKVKVVLFLSLPKKVAGEKNDPTLIRLKYGSDGKVINKIERF